MPKVPAAYIEARREAIIEAARRAFARKGPDNTTMAEIAAETGLTPGALYRYFPTKDDLVDRCFTGAMDEVMQRWKEAPDPSSDPMDDLEELATLTFRALNFPDERTDTIIHLEHELALVRSGDATGLKEWRADRAQATERIAQRLAAAQKLGQLPELFDPPQLAAALMSFYWGARMSRVVTPEADTDSQLRQVLLLLRAVNPKRRD